MSTEYSTRYLSPSIKVILLTMESRLCLEASTRTENTLSVCNLGGWDDEDDE